MLVQFGTSGLAGYGLYFGDRKQQLFGTMSYLVTFFQRDTRQGRYVDCERTFIKRRQERTSQCEEAGKRHHKQADGSAQYALLMPQHKGKSRAVPFFHFARYRRVAGGTFFIFYLFSSQQIGTQYGRHCQRHDRGSSQRHDERDTQRYEHPAFHAAQEE